LHVPHWQGLGLLIRLANPHCVGVGIYTISRGKHHLVGIYYSEGGSGEGPLNFFCTSKPASIVGLFSMILLGLFAIKVCYQRFTDPLVESRTPGSTKKEKNPSHARKEGFWAPTK